MIFRNAGLIFIEILRNDPAGHETAPDFLMRRTVHEDHDYRALRHLADVNASRPLTAPLSVSSLRVFNIDAITKGNRIAKERRPAVTRRTGEMKGVRLIRHGLQKSSAENSVPDCRRETSFSARRASGSISRALLQKDGGVQAWRGQQRALAGSEFKLLIVVSSCNDHINWASSLL